MNVVLIGSGNVAWNIGRLVKLSGHDVVQVIARNAKTGTELAYALDTESANYWSILKKDADVYIICVNDDALPEAVMELTEMKVKKGLVLHTSGTVPVEALRGTSSKYGVLYPLQSLRYGAKDLPEIPFLVEGKDEATAAIVKSFAYTLTDNIQAVTTEQRQKMHIAAVLVNNFANYLFIQAEEWCIKNKLEFKQLIPLIRETGLRMDAGNPKGLQTGPAIRNDVTTIDLHRKLLADDPELLGMYDRFTKGIMMMREKMGVLVGD